MSTKQLHAVDIDVALAEGYLAAGVKPSVVAKRSKAGAALVERLKLAGQGRARRVASNANTWSKADEAFLLAQYRFMPIDELARELGRSAVGVRIHLKRMRVPMPSKHPEEITARGIEKMLGAELHAICHWIDSGILPGRTMPGGRGIRLVNRVTFMRWCITPENWLRFKVERVRDLKLKRLIQLRMQRWGDEWWDTKQVARYHNALHDTVNGRIQTGSLKPVKVENYSGRHHTPGWTRNYFLKSEAIHFVFTSGKGSSRCTEIKPAAKLERLIVEAAGAGVPQVCLAKMIGWTVKQLAYWLRSRKGSVKDLPFVDWRTMRGIPFVRRAVHRFIAGKPLRYDQALVIRGVMQAWCRRHHIDIVKGNAGKFTDDTLRRLWHAMQAAGADPFEVSS
jgi:hypothetical protein